MNIINKLKRAFLKPIVVQEQINEYDEEGNLAGGSTKVTDNRDGTCSFEMDLSDNPIVLAPGESLTVGLRGKIDDHSE